MKSTLHKLGRKLGRRAHERFTIPGASVSWVKDDPGPFPGDPLPLSDISKIGLAFLTNHPADEGAEVFLRVHFPKPPEFLELRGIVRYSIPRGPGLTYEYRIGIEFKPFSGEAGCNPPDAIGRILELEQMYGKHLDLLEEN